MIAASRSVAVAAAANIGPALAVVVSDFQKEHPDIRVDVTYGSSGHLFEELEKRAFDIYMSSDEEYPQQLVEGGLARSGSDFQYARGTLAIWAPRTLSLDLQKLGAQSLLNMAIRKIAISDPEHTPYGRATFAALKKLGIYEQVQSKLLPCEDAAQAARLVDGGSAEVALIATPLAVALSSKNGHYWQLPLDSYPPISEEGVILEWARDAEGARALRDYIVGPAGRATFQRLGFLVPS
jgi:molybdate transport system substrate-binding protein